MNQVRTTITLPADTHEYLMTLSFQKKKTLGELVDGLVKNKNYLASDVQKKQDLDAFRAFCAKMAKKAGKVDWVKEIRKTRDERADQLVGRISKT